MLFVKRKPSCHKAKSKVFVSIINLPHRLISRFCIWKQVGQCKGFVAHVAQHRCVKLCFPWLLCCPWKLHVVANSTLFSFSHSICHDTFATSCVLLMHCSGILPTSQPAVLQFRQVPHAEPRLLPARQRHDRRHRGHPQPAGEQTSPRPFWAAEIRKQERCWSDVCCMLLGSFEY